MYNSKCAIGLQAAASRFERFWAVSRAPLRGGLPPPLDPSNKRLRRAPEALFGGVVDPPQRGSAGDCLQQAEAL
eukprot:14591335-Alexandrium_andersonii.AAC.1